MSTPNDILKQIDRNRRDYREEVAQIRNDRDLSGEGKAKRLAAAYQKASERHTQLKRQYSDEVGATRQFLEGKAFAAPAGRSAEYRLAVAAAAAIDNPGDRRKAIELARKTGDTLALRAHATLAHANNDWGNVVPLADTDRDIANLVDFERNDGGRLTSANERFARQVGLHGPDRPTDVSNSVLNDTQVGEGE